MAGIEDGEQFRGFVGVLQNLVGFIDEVGRMDSRDRAEDRRLRYRGC